MSPTIHRCLPFAPRRLKGAGLSSSHFYNTERWELRKSATSEPGFVVDANLTRPWNCCAVTAEGVWGPCGSKVEIIAFSGPWKVWAWKSGFRTTSSSFLSLPKCHRRDMAVNGRLSEMVRLCGSTQIIMFFNAPPTYIPSTIDAVKRKELPDMEGAISWALETSVRNKLLAFVASFQSPSASAAFLLSDLSFFLFPWSYILAPNLREEHSSSPGLDLRVPTGSDDG
ncbi:hypothetical protein BDN67DRAFT_984107, partial [Paxillus ammoniavirescens]